MVDEEKQEETTEEEASVQTPAEDAVEETPAAEEEAPEEEPAAEAEEAPAEETAEEAPAPAAAAEPEEPTEEPTPKQRRKLERSTHEGEARPQRSPEERAAERASARAGNAGSRRRARASVRQRRGEPGHGTPPADREPGTKKVRQGIVVSAKPDKTITVRIEITRRHPTYEKVVRRTNTIHAHDESNEAHEGDKVRVVEARPLSKTKRWRLVEVLERAR
jgi:small subunit ribosomal protein S17